MRQWRFGQDIERTSTPFAAIAWQFPGLPPTGDVTAVAMRATNAIHPDAMAVILAAATQPTVELQTDPHPEWANQSLQSTSTRGWRQVDPWH